MNTKLCLKAGLMVLCLAFLALTNAKAVGTPDEWLGRSAATVVPGRAVHSAVWTGQEMIIWGGEGPGVSYNSGARFLVKSNSWTATSTVNAPANRSQHNAVWTGTEMIVWGGYNGSYLQSGGRYNPSTDSWQATSTTGAPAARSAAAVIWTGSEMIIWSGHGAGNVLLASGALYNPTNNTWRPMSTTGAPSARGGVNAVWTGTEMLIWGGHNNSIVHNDGALYNPATDTWRPVSSVNAPSARTWILTPVWTGTELIVWGGGNLALSQTFNDGARYNPTTDTWTTMSSTGAPSGRNRAAMAWTGKEMVLFGGATGAGTGTYSNTGASYNPVTDTWAPMTTTGAPGARVHHSAVWTGASVLVYGGYNGSGHNQDCTSYSPSFNYQVIMSQWLAENFGGYFRHQPAAAEYADPDGDGFNNLVEFDGGSDPNSTSSVPMMGEWLQRANNTEVPGRSIYVSAWTGKELLIWGGEGFGVSYDSGARYSPASNTWTPMSEVDKPENRSQHAGVWTGTEFIVWGGYNGAQLNSGGRYDPKTDTWHVMSTVGAPSARSYPAIAWTGEEVIVWGGVSNGTYLNDGAIYNPESDSWRALASVGAPIARCLPAHAWSGAELVVWGGSGSAGALGDGAAYNVETDTWRAVSSVNAPSARTWLFQTTWTGTEMIVWGGANQGLTASYNDGARYNPTTDTWTTMSTVNAPSARNRHALTWAGDRMFVFGGAFNNSGFLNTGGIYNPVTDKWSLLTTTNAPSARVHHHAVWTGASVLVYGGYTGVEHSSQIYSYSPKDITGVSSEWLAEYFGEHYRHNPNALLKADPDDDGSTNQKEFEDETNPLDPFSGFALGIRMTPTVVWRSVPGVSYRVLRKTNINDPAWEEVGIVTPTGKQGVYADILSETDTGFYKVEPIEL
ncbi:MAG TPA: kelch repeat-containing protein [Verrucomicrobiae bacterium]